MNESLQPPRLEKISSSCLSAYSPLVKRKVGQEKVLGHFNGLLLVLSINKMLLLAKKEIRLSPPLSTTGANINNCSFIVEEYEQSCFFPYVKKCAKHVNA